MPRLFLFCFLLLPIFAQSCGYSLVGKGTALPPGISSASIPLFENLAGEPNLETNLTNAVKDAFIRDGRLSIKSGKTADAKISGVVESYILRPSFVRRPEQGNKLSGNHHRPYCRDIKKLWHSLYAAKGGDKLAL